MTTRCRAMNDGQYMCLEASCAAIFKFRPRTRDRIPDIRRLLLDGKSNKAVAAAAGVSRYVVETVAALLFSRKSRPNCPCGDSASHGGRCEWKDEGYRSRLQLRSSARAVWPYLSAHNPDDGELLLVAVNRAVPKDLPEDIRADVCQDICAAVLSGDVAIENMTTEVPMFVRRGWRAYSLQPWGRVSLDAPVCRGDISGKRYGEVIGAHESL